MSEQATVQWYRSERGRWHLQDPHLPGPEYDWVNDPWGWTVHTRCGLVMRRMQPSTDEVGRACEKCSAKLLQEQRA